MPATVDGGGSTSGSAVFDWRREELTPLQRWVCQNVKVSKHKEIAMEEGIDGTEHKWHEDRMDWRLIVEFVPVNVLCQLISDYAIHGHVYPPLSSQINLRTWCVGCHSYRVSFASVEFGSLRLTVLNPDDDERFTSSFTEAWVYQFKHRDHFGELNYLFLFRVSQEKCYLVLGNYMCSISLPQDTRILRFYYYAGTYPDSNHVVVKTNHGPLMYSVYDTYTSKNRFHSPAVLMDRYALRGEMLDD